MITIDIKNDFSSTTGFRTYSDGPKSGLEFYDVLLREKFKEAQELKLKLKVILDGGEGYTSSFLNEAFRLLGQTYGSDNVWNNLIVVSEEMPKYIKKIKDSIYEMGK
jgi:phosphomannomutase